MTDREQKPVAWWNGKESVVFAHDEICTPNWTDYWTKPLYAIPPQRQWTGLTDDEIKSAVLDNPVFGAALMSMVRDDVKVATLRQAINGIARAVEAKLKEKNT